MQKNQRRRDVDGLRAVAVIPIVLMHAGVPGFQGGFVGVDIFFVISGFLITGILFREKSQGTFSLLHFYERRVRRLFPAVVAMLTTCLVTAAIYMPPTIFVDIAISSVATVFMASNIHFYREAVDYFAVNTQLNPLLHTWSLGVEEQFFLLFPLFFMIVFGIWKRALIPVLSMFTALSFCLCIWMTYAYPVASFYFLPTRAWELGIGALLSLLNFKEQPKYILTEASSLAGAMMIVSAIIILDEASPFPGFYALLPTLGTALILWGGISTKTVVSRVLATPLLVGTGLISYSLYLWHWPILVFSRLKAGSLDLSFVDTLLALVISLFVAAISWRFIEKPFRKFPPEGFGRKPVLAGVVFMAATVTGSSILTVVNEGFPIRISDKILNIYEVSNEKEAPGRSCHKSPGKDAVTTCLLGEQTSKVAPVDMLVWGDSHARAAQPGLSRFLNESGLTGLLKTKPACPPVVDIKKLDLQRDESCQAFNRSVIRMLDDRTDLKTVILIARWPIYAGEGRLPDEKPVPVLIRPTAYLGTDRNERNNIRYLEPRFLQTVDAIISTGRRVVIFESLPEIGWSPPIMIGNNLLFGARLPSAPNKQSVADRNIRVKKMIGRASQKPEVSSVDPISYLCRTTCIVQLDGRPIYRDSTHLSAYGSQIIIPVLMNKIAWKEYRAEIRRNVSQ